MSPADVTERRVAAVERALLRQRFPVKLRDDDPRVAEIIRALNLEIAAEERASVGISDRYLRLIGVIGALREIASTAVRTVRLLEDDPALVAMFLPGGDDHG
jgi:hypothetical protein